jgi:hypothetical protein
LLLLAAALVATTELKAVALAAVQGGCYLARLNTPVELKLLPLVLAEL